MTCAEAVRSGSDDLARSGCGIFSARAGAVLSFISRLSIVAHQRVLHREVHRVENLSSRW